MLNLINAEVLFVRESIIRTGLPSKDKVKASSGGAIKLDGDRVSNFKEKSKMEEGWINGGFFVIEPGFFDYIKDDHTYLEREPLELVAKKKELYAFRHDGFWQCMDTKRDKDYLEEIYKKGLAPWQK